MRRRAVKPIRRHIRASDGAASGLSDRCRAAASSTASSDSTQENPGSGERNHNKTG